MKKLPVALALSAALVGAIALSGCSSSGDKKPETTLTLMTWHGPDSTTKYYEGYKEIAENYMADHPDVTIEIKHEEDASFGSILETGFAGGTAPDIIQMKSAQRATFAGELLDLREYLAKPSPYAKGGKWIDTFVGGEAAFPPEDNGTNPNSLLFVPNDGNPEVYAGKMFIFNKELISKAGLDPNTTPQDWKDMFEWLEALKDDPDVAPIAGSNDVGGKVSQIGYGFGPGYADKFFADKFNNAEFASEIQNDKLYILTCYTGGPQMPLTDLPYYPAMFKLMAKHISYYQPSWTENSPETEVLTFASGKAALMNTTFWDYGTLVGSLSEATFPKGFGLFQLPYFGDETLGYAVDKGWITQEDADAAAPYVVDRPANFGGAGKHEYGFTVNKEVAKRPAKLKATVDFLAYLSSQKVQAKYVKTASSLSPVEGVELIDSMSTFVIDEPEGGFAERVLGYTVVEWGKGGWDVDVTKFLSGDLPWEKMVKNVAAPEYVKDIPTMATLRKNVAAAKAEMSSATDADAEAKKHAYDFAQLRLDLFDRYYYGASGGLETVQ